MTAAPMTPGSTTSPAAPPPDPERITEELDAVTRQLDDLGSRPVGEHVAYFEALHTALQDALASIDGL